MNSIEQGLAIMALGLSLTFGALAIFIGIIWLLQRLFPPEQETRAEQGKATDPSAASLLTRDTAEEEIVVAITVALAQLYSYELCRSSLGVSLEQGQGPWWSEGRLEQTPPEIVSVRGRN